MDSMDSIDPTDAIRLDQVSFTYAEAVAPALRGVSLRVGQGEMLVILGASGAGKCTQVKCLNRIIPAFQSGRLTGEVRLFGRRLVQEKVGELAGTVGMVFQDFEAQLFSTTVRDEVLFGMEQLGVEPREMRHRLSEVLAPSVPGTRIFSLAPPSTCTDVALPLSLAMPMVQPGLIVPTGGKVTAM